MENNKTLSVLILTYNVCELTKNCIVSVLDAIKTLNEFKYSAEIIISDNASTDGTVEMVETEFPELKIFKNKNIGFAKGNNVARQYINSKYILILNPDTVVEKNTLLECVKYMESHENVGAMTCKVVLPNNELDKDTRRSFPTPWIALSHFSYLDRLFPRSKLFSKYWYGYLPDDMESPVDVIQGAFCFVRKDVMDLVDWYDEDYFLDGEDIDLCWKIHGKGFAVIYYPKVKIIHYKGASKGKSGVSALNKKVNKFDKIRAVFTGTNSMKIFYDKHLKKRYPAILTYLVYFAISSLKIKRIFSILLKGSR